MKRIIYIGLFIFSLASLFSSCDNNDTKTAQFPTLSAYLQSQSNLTIFAAALERAELQVFRDGPGPFTWLVPTDEAFTAAGITVATLQQMTPGQVNYLIQYHMINANVTTKDLLGIQFSIARATQLGISVYLGQKNDSFYVNGSSIISPNNTLSNGVVHVINRVNTPPALKGSLQNILTSSGQHSLFIAALTRANRWTALASSVYTILAPTDAAMTAAGFTTASINASTVGGMDTLVTYHMFNNIRLFSNDFGDKLTPRTLLSSSATLLASNNGKSFKGRSNTGTVDIIIPDILGTNGVVHFINGVLRY